MSYNWPYFHLEPSKKPTFYVIVDEEGVVLTRNGDPILVVDEEEAEDILEDLNIRGSVI
jgi:hypothetical protein